MNGKPDWKNAPEWARFLAMDETGDWYWYENKPFINGQTWYQLGGKWKIAHQSIKEWKSTLEERPQ